MHCKAPFRQPEQASQALKACQKTIVMVQILHLSSLPDLPKSEPLSWLGSGSETSFSRSAFVVLPVMQMADTKALSVLRHCHNIYWRGDSLLVFPYTDHPRSHLVKCCWKPLSKALAEPDCPDVCKTAANFAQCLHSLDCELSYCRGPTMVQTLKLEHSSQAE